MYKFNKSIICPNDPTATDKRIREYSKYYEVKYEICKQQSPKVIVEIGVRAGYSAWAFLQACPNAKYMGIDANNGKHGGKGGEDGSFMKWAKKLLKPYDVSFFEIDTQETDSLPGKVKNVDFFHVDGDHSINGVYHDLDLASKVISKNGLILIDDITYLAKTVKVGADKWLEDNPEFSASFIKSFRGEYLVKKMGEN